MGFLALEMGYIHVVKCLEGGHPSKIDEWGSSASHGVYAPALIIWKVYIVHTFNMWCLLRPSEVYAHA